MIAKVVKNLSLEHKSRHLKELVQESQASELGKRIEARLDDSEFSLKSLAQELGFSPNHLSLLIKKKSWDPFSGLSGAGADQTSEIIVADNGFENL